MNLNYWELEFKISLMNILKDIREDVTNMKHKKKKVEILVTKT